MLGFADNTTEYERKRQERIAANQALLQSLGIERPPAAQPFSKAKRKANSEDASTPVVKKKKVKVVKEEAVIEDDSDQTLVRRSRRLRDKPTPSLKDENMYEEVKEEDDGLVSVPVKEKLRTRLSRTSSKKVPRENTFGHIPGVPVGRRWAMRMDCSHDGVHRPPVSGIHGGPDGCYSVALSGGYEDDVDFGEAFTYTGEGGRDLSGTKTNPKNLRTAPQSKDQVLDRGNLALWKSAQNGLPVRVVRGYKLPSPYAPEEGYRYDGLYKVEKAWSETGLAGFLVYKFALKRLPGQPPLPRNDEQDASFCSEDETKNVKQVPDSDQDVKSQENE
ncbi:uncharacterized protein SPPG_07168 [Spizellomyces punctatus DAOM BR117]|uniref:YDG domain-containing protein n=1 Tax=Spizellomyces punctatus (strain DAOM BR117) TaxID=645134 RepID=A0A0L0H9L2_SPIPD|nr:uncharacterized protein SPPG_07168 [Spizellomyces punctatus DAOM BR117]KNC97706.1 hypothetical protein SPPG_07168 [Spizellomyces punctatus DAOM BR117]|eukprot:XP_016605746.1 hypothetical protein SPPG_07168 [Spizellomyces punctatus DAOM BR117]